MFFNSEQGETQSHQDEEQEGEGDTSATRLGPEAYIVAVCRLFPNSGAGG